MFSDKNELHELPKELEDSINSGTSQDELLLVWNSLLRRLEPAFKKRNIIIPEVSWEDLTFDFSGGVLPSGFL